MERQVQAARVAVQVGLILAAAALASSAKALTAQLVLGVLEVAAAPAVQTVLVLSAARMVEERQETRLVI
jgi:hypothetical protein